GICARRLATRLPGSPAANFSGMSRSTPYGRPPVCSSIQVSWASSSSGLYPDAASTPSPPALQTAATTPGDLLNPAIGSCTPSRAVNAVGSILQTIIVRSSARKAAAFPAAGGAARPGRDERRRPMAIDEATAGFLAQLAESGLKPLHEMTPDEARAVG